MSQISYRTQEERLPRTSIACEEEERIGRGLFYIFVEGTQCFPLVAGIAIQRKRAEGAKERCIRHVIIISIFVRVKLRIIGIGTALVAPRNETRLTQTTT